MFLVAVFNQLMLCRDIEKKIHDLHTQFKLLSLKNFIRVMNTLERIQCDCNSLFAKSWSRIRKFLI